ncbi:MAG: hypothetical protein Q4E56_03570 [Pseudomonadota bacterium]|nr:hypothetical protein [Pseudomonadota bacterium]
MKTKIIYISGSEIFDMADIRAAFEEVRGALGLDSDTVLFGVPVDNDNALGATDDAHLQPEPAVAIDDTPVMETVTPEIIPEPVIDIEPAPEIEPEKPKKKSRGRPAKITKAEEVVPDAVVVTEATEAAEPESEPVTVADAPANVSSILSVLTSKPADEPEPVVADVTESAPDIDVADTAEPVEVVAESVEENITESVVAEPAVVDAEPVITETDTVQVATTDITDEAPEEPIEKTLEQLLESMTPLREDHMDEDVAQSADDEFDMSPAPVDTTDGTSDADDDDTDATLAQLATEFAENQDKIPTPKKTEARGKIGKLKNILPFKKAKRDDTGLMGDLFGWAGIAANDDDFAMPGFFTGVASKK